MALFETTIEDDEFSVTIRAEMVRGEKLIFIVEEAMSNRIEGSPMPPTFALRMAKALAAAAAA